MKTNEPRHNWCGRCERCGEEHYDMLEVIDLNRALEGRPIRRNPARLQWR